MSEKYTGTSNSMTLTERISVIIPTYNSAKFIARTIQSVVAQTYRDVEIVVIDDASTDATDEALAEFAGQITYIRSERQTGVSGARNRGAAAATGTWLAFLDHDDWWPPTFLELAAPQLHSDSALCYDNILVSNPDGIEPVELNESIETLHGRANGWTDKTVDRSNLVKMFKDAPILKSIVHRDAFARGGGFDSRFHGVEDFHYHVKLAANGIKLILVSRPYGFYRIHANQTTAAISAGPQRDPARHLGSCLKWFIMFRSLPHELSLDNASKRACNVARAYWGFRYVREAIVVAKLRNNWMSLLSPQFLTCALYAVPAISAKLMRRKTIGG